MADVAGKVDLPIKIEIPLFNQEALRPCVMLGLGDMVIPGLFIVFLKRFDESNHRKVYFLVGMISYAIALALCALVLYFFQSAQPALLYISPLLLIPTIITAH